MVTVAGGGCKGVCCGERVSVLVRFSLQMGSGCHMPTEMDIEFLVLCFVAGFFLLLSSSGWFRLIPPVLSLLTWFGHLHVCPLSFDGGLVFHWKTHSGVVMKYLCHLFHTTDLVC